MKLKNITLKTSITAVALIAGVLIGTLLISPISAKEKNTNQNFPTNENGQTFGSEMYVTNREDAPDLILAKGTDGEVGYVKKDDLDEDLPSSPEEALAVQEENEGKDRTIPLYASDGTTVVGEFIISNGDTTETTSEGETITITER